MQVPFAKYHGSGNDFILIDDRKGDFPHDRSDFISHLCHRRHGIGADGVILLQCSNLAHFRMRIFNADGSEPAMCGNGLRCFVDFLRSLHLIEEIVQVETGSGVLECRWAPGRIAVNLGTPRLLCHHLPLSVAGRQLEVHVVDSGVPHCIVFAPDVQAVPLEALGPQLRHHAQFFPHGVNVNVASVHEHGRLSVRTYERGVEGETSACGTGVAAVAWLAARMHPLGEMIPVMTQGGEELAVRLLASREVELMGPAVRVFEGNFSF
jgi:diaminopimelate epimerase